MENASDSQPRKPQPKAAPAANSPVFKNARLAICGLTGLCVTELLGRLEAPGCGICLGLYFWNLDFLGRQQNKSSRDNTQRQLEGRRWMHSCHGVTIAKEELSPLRASSVKLWRAFLFATSSRN